MSACFLVIGHELSEHIQYFGSGLYTDFAFDVDVGIIVDVLQQLHQESEGGRSKIGVAGHLGPYIEHSHMQFYALTHYL